MDNSSDAVNEKKHSFKKFAIAFKNHFRFGIKLIKRKSGSIKYSFNFNNFLSKYNIQINSLLKIDTMECLMK